MRMRTNSRQQRAKRAERKQRRQIAREAARTRVYDALKSSTVLRYEDYDFNSPSREVGAMIKKYHDYVDKGRIKPRTFVSNYEQASWMRNEVLSIHEMEAAIAQADRWGERARARAKNITQEEIDFLQSLNF